VWNYSIWRTKSGLRWGLRSGFDPDVDTGNGCPGHWVGIVSPKCLNGDNAWARQSVFGPGSIRLFWLSEGQAR